METGKLTLWLGALGTLQKTPVQLLAPTRHLAAVSNSSSRGPGGLFWLSQDFCHVVQIHAKGKTPMHLDKSIFKNSLIVIYKEGVLAL